MIINSSILKALTMPDRGFRSIFNSLDYNWESNGYKTEGKFFYMHMRDGQPVISDLVEYLMHHLVYFCIPRTEIEAAMEVYKRTNDLAPFSRLHRQASKLFSKAITEGRISGEGGEIILFTLLELAVGAPQLVAKMSLKTNTEMPVHGSDGIHISFDDSKQNLRLYYGESKIQKKFSNAVDNALTSVKEFLDPDTPGRPYENEIRVAKQFCNVTDPDLRAEIIKYLDPFEDDSKHMNREEWFACFVGFDFDFYKQISKLNKDNVELYFEEKYVERIKTGCRVFCNHIDKKNLNNRRFLFMILPFHDVDEFRKRFIEDNF